VQRLQHTLEQLLTLAVLKDLFLLKRAMLFDPGHYQVVAG